jgi:hypothetical protein
MYVPGVMLLSGVSDPAEITNRRVHVQLARIPQARARSLRILLLPSGGFPVQRITESATLPTMHTKVYTCYTEPN